ncbi:hypothetical protein PENSPDRAFT_655028 [Peniophora sp. CONT]|nr:hypothetical protein PENSPDRAFT_655028 [Peniophora sp. CONT]
MPSSNSTTTRRRSLSTRRGSITAPDPYGQHIHLNHEPGRSTSCKLSIVRVLSPPPIQLEQPPQSAGHRRHIHRDNHRRTGSGGNTQGGSPRMSFASASFATPGSPTALRPVSPTHHRNHTRAGSHGLDSKPRLNADQLVALAQESTSPHSPAPLSSPNLIGGAHTVDTAPANFMPLADDVYLPFVNRAEEVSALFSGPPCSKLLHLLSQTFAGSPAATPVSATPEDAVFELDPKRWSAPQLAYWLKKVDRDQVPDDIWVSRARRCVLEHSELIWQRIKGALGVPPELDYDVDEDELASSSGETSDAIPTPDHSVAGLVDEVMTGSMSPEIPVKVSPPEGDGLSHADEDIDWLDLSHDISIEPIIRGSSTAQLLDAPPTRPGAHTIHESVQEEDEDEDVAPTPAPASPEIVQGIRISTTPVTPGLFGSQHTHSPAISARSHTSPMRSFTPLPDAHELAGSISSSASYTWGRARSNSTGSNRHYASSVTSSEGVYDALGERGPGNPLFPSSFARLTIGPTLSANNPSLRRPSLPPPPMFGNPHIIRGRRGPPSWMSESYDPAKHEYAVTVGSESSMSAIAV